MFVPGSDIDELVEGYLELSDSAENRRRQQYWEPELCARDQFHGLPKEGLFRSQGCMPVEIDIQHTFFTRVCPHDLRQVYGQPDEYLRFYLQKRLFAFREIPDDTPLDGIIPIYLGTVLEPSLFGVGSHFSADAEPVIDQSHAPIHSRDDLGRLDEIDFMQSGLMPQAIRLYEGVGELLHGRLQVVFPEWLRGPLGVALYVRGYQDLLVDLANDPDFASDVMGRITGARMTWFRERARYLGEPIPEGSLFNDEVDASVIGRRHYERFIRPHEEVLGRFHGTISYWHSCGDTGPFAGSIAEMGCVRMLDISGWTDRERALASLPAPAPRLEIRFKPVQDLQDASTVWQASRLRETVEACRRHDVESVALRCSGLQPWGTPEQDLAQIRNWIDLARTAQDEVGVARATSAKPPAGV